MSDVESFDAFHSWGLLGQSDDHTFAMRVVNRRTGRQRLVIIKRSVDGNASIVELGIWGLKHRKRPWDCKQAWLRPPPIMARERMLAYEGDGGRG